MDSGIERGYNWIVQFVTNHWFRINSRVQTAIEEEAEVQRLRLQTLRNKYGGLDKADETKEKTKMNGKSNKDPFRPIKEVVQEIDRRKESESNEMTNQMNGNLPENNPNTVEDATFDVKPNLIEENATHLAIGGGKISEQKTEI